MAFSITDAALDDLLDHVKTASAWQIQYTVSFSNRNTESAQILVSRGINAIGWLGGIQYIVEQGATGTSDLGVPNLREVSETIQDGVIVGPMLSNSEILSKTMQVKDGIITDSKIVSINANKLTNGTALSNTLTVSGATLSNIKIWAENAYGEAEEAALSAAAAAESAALAEDNKFVWKGDYDPEVGYVVRDTVFYQGSTYLSTFPGTGKLPTDAAYWDLFAYRGDKGDQGIQGVIGPKGNLGAAGVDGTDGSQGVQGFQGPIGEDGPNGPQGGQGNTGLKGDPGGEGDKGPTGDNGPMGATPLGLAFGYFKIDANGDLQIEFYGSGNENDFSINTDGELLVTTV
jgi:hypothetical protein